ncbi:isochorismatase family protein [Streptomyces sp. LS1784]|uniref:isochorismatase family protein n=1 Tax=Streptomyces sp. LS1784 TaxID=2851533 RepID=UPI0035A8FFF5
MAEHLQELGVTQVVVCGLSAAIGVESTARQAHEHGFHVALPLGAMTDLDAATHENSATLIFPRLGETGATAEVLAHIGA